MNVLLIVNIIAFVIILVALGFMSARHKWSLSRKVIIGLVIGVVFGGVLNAIYHTGNETLTKSISWFDIVGNGYVSLLQMIIMPLVFISILNAVARLHKASQLGKISMLTIGTLLVTTAIAALIGILTTLVFRLSASGLVQGDRETARIEQIQGQSDKVSDLTVPQLILSFIPKNPFADLAGANPTSIISVVIFAAFLGVAALRLMRSNAEFGTKVLAATQIFEAWIMKLVRLVISFTPYGVFALMTKVVANSNLQDIIKLGTFVVASYTAIAIMFLIHATILGIAGINPVRFFRKVAPVLSLIHI